MQYAKNAVPDHSSLFANPLSILRDMHKKKKLSQKSNV